MPRRSLNASRPVDPRADEALDAALAASSPAGDPVAMLEPVSGADPTLSGPDTGLAEVRAPSLSRKKDIPL